MNSIQSVFVYGSLKRDYLRGNQWPRSPISISQGIVAAKLYDLGPYPAVCLVSESEERSEWVLGEIWKLASADIDETLAVLDKIEGYEALGKANEYIREEVDVRLEHGNHTIAYIYRFANLDRLAKLRQIEPEENFDGVRCAAWPDRYARVPKSFDDE